MRLVVLGMHRSGTSVATGVLELAGAWVGDPAELTKANAENPRGFFERRDVREVCDAILQSHGMDWWRTSALQTDFEPTRVRPHLERFAEIMNTLDARGTWVIKEPRLCLVLPALLPALDGARFVHVMREPLEVASSLTARNAIPPAAGVALWEQYVRTAVQYTTGRPRTMVRYERLVADPLRTTTELVGSLTELGVDDLVIPSAAALGSLVTSDLHRERASPAERGDRFNVIPGSARNGRRRRNPARRIVGQRRPLRSGPARCWRRSRRPVTASNSSRCWPPLAKPSPPRTKRSPPLTKRSPSNVVEPTTPSAMPRPLDGPRRTSGQQDRRGGRGRASPNRRCQPIPSVAGGRFAPPSPARRHRRNTVRLRPSADGRSRAPAAARLVGA